jgi:hypothetical protein
MLSLPELPSASEAAWRAFLETERSAARPQMLTALRSFISTTADVEPRVLDVWALALVEAVLDGGEDLILRQPLLDAIILPALVRGYRAGAPRPTTWLSRLSRELVRNRSLHEEAGGPDSFELLRRAFERNPTDERCRVLLRERLARRIEHSLHELPVGVLFGGNGATAEEIELLSSDLRLLEAIIQPGSELVVRARIHFAVYAEWLRTRTGSYAEYFNAHSGSPELLE